MIKVFNRYIMVVALLVLVFAMATHVFFHFAPGAMSPDSFTILAQARSSVFEDGHPPLMATIWRELDRLVPGPLGMLLLNLTLFYFGIFLIFLWAMPKYGIAALPASIVAGLFPPIISIIGVIWIDITMAAFFLFAIGVYLTGHFYSKKIIRVATLFLSLLFVTLGIAIRHNGAAAALPLVIFIFISIFDTQSKFLSKIILPMLVGSLVTGALFIATKQISSQYVDKPRNLWRAAAMYDIAGASYYENKNLFYDSVLTHASLDNINKLYSPRSFTPLVLGEQIHALNDRKNEKAIPFEFNEANPLLNKQLFENWINVISHYPKSYLNHRFAFYSSLVTRSPWGLWAPYFDVIYPNNLGIYERPVTDSHYFSFTRRLSQNSVFFVPLLYLVLSAIMVIPTLVLGFRLQNHVLLVASSFYGSGLMHMTGLFFFAVTPDYRYSHWLITATVLATSLTMLELRRTWKTRLASKKPIETTKIVEEYKSKSKAASGNT